MLTKGCQAPLEPVVVLFEILILHKILTFLVYAVIGQLIEYIGLRVLRGVLLACKPHEAFLINIDSQRLVGRHKDVYSQIKFMAIDQQRVGDIP
jgi:hypothetical protein